MVGPIGLMPRFAHSGTGIHWHPRHTKDLLYATALQGLNQQRIAGGSFRFEAAQKLGPVCRREAPQPLLQATLDEAVSFVSGFMRLLQNPPAAAGMLRLEAASPVQPRATRSPALLATWPVPCANNTTVGFLKRVINGISISSAFASLTKTCVARMESPPRAKKLSLRPT